MDKFLTKDKLPKHTKEIDNLSKSTCLKKLNL